MNTRGKRGEREREKVLALSSITTPPKIGTVRLERRVYQKVKENIGLQKRPGNTTTRVSLVFKKRTP